MDSNYFTDIYRLIIRVHLYIEFLDKKIVSFEISAISRL